MGTLPEICQRTACVEEGRPAVPILSPCHHPRPRRLIEPPALQSWPHSQPHRVPLYCHRLEMMNRMLIKGWTLEEEMATPSSILVWETPSQRSLVGYSPRGCKESDTSE